MADDLATDLAMGHRILDVLDEQRKIYMEKLIALQAKQVLLKRDLSSIGHYLRTCNELSDLNPILNALDKLITNM